MRVTRTSPLALLAAALPLGLAWPLTGASAGDGTTHDARADADGGAGRPGQQHATADCMECHEDMRPVIEASVPHEPAYSEECTLCHSPHAARYAKLLNKRERALCAACHRDSVLSFQKGHIHTPVRQGKCVACHEVHGSEHEGLVTAEGNDLCFSCHEDVQAKASWPTPHEPFAEGECSDCHDPHNSDHPDQLVAQANALCVLCHDADDAELVEAHYEVPIEGTNCRGCHDPHASRQDGLLLPFTHEPFTDGSCEACHRLDTATPQLVHSTGRRLCDLCHQDFPRKNDPIVHQPVADGACGSCHLPHAGRHDGLLPATLRETCLTCHTDISERAQTAKSTHPTLFEDGKSCDACHRAHTSTEEHLLVTGGIRTCLACHETERHGHPLGDDRIDPRTGEGITCVTCHDPHGTEFSYQLVGERSRGLCLECHDTERKADTRRRR